jgi:CDGSH-type Zn-finger protein
MEEKKPTIQISKTGKVTVLNAQDIVLLDSDGNEIPKRNRFSLCNCGKSGDLPFCDGSHNK